MKWSTLGTWGEQTSVVWGAGVGCSPRFVAHAKGLLSTPSAQTTTLEMA
jgi:hypothetical protein